MSDPGQMGSSDRKWDLGHPQTMLNIISILVTVAVSVFAQGPMKPIAIVQADVQAKRIVEATAKRDDFTLGLRDNPLPFFNESSPPPYITNAWSGPASEAWRQKLKTYDGDLATVSEYSHGPTAGLKNAFDNAFYEWKRSPIAFVGHGGVTAAGAIEQPRGIAVELQTAPIRHEVNIVMEPYSGVSQQG
ncbi:MAG: NAD(P)H-dependent oxidoreductase [Hyphomonadaceae bacterium]